MTDPARRAGCRHISIRLAGRWVYMLGTPRKAFIRPCAVQHRHMAGAPWYPDASAPLLACTALGTAEARRTPQGRDLCSRFRLVGLWLSLLAIASLPLCHVKSPFEVRGNGCRFLFGGFSTLASREANEVLEHVGDRHFSALVLPGRCRRKETRADNAPSRQPQAMLRREPRQTVFPAPLVDPGEISRLLPPPPASGGSRLLFERPGLDGDRA